MDQPARDRSCVWDQKSERCHLPLACPGEEGTDQARAEYVACHQPDPATCKPTGIPLQGVIAAGRPIETYEQTERIDFTEMFTKPEYFALKVRGDSMVEDHISDGDFVIVKQQETARDGQIVVALVDGAETTLKRFYRDKADSDLSQQTRR